MKGQALETTLKEIADLWHEFFPNECETIARVVEEESKNLVRPCGLSRNGTMMSFAKITPKLYAFVKRTMRRRHGIPEFFSDEANYRLLLKCWPTLAVRHKPTQYFKVPAL